MPSFPIFANGQSPATTGWLGTMFLDSYPIRFDSENITIPMGLEVATDVHSGMRVPAVFEYRFIIPDGTFSFPLMCDPSVVVAAGSPATGLDSGTEAILKAAIQPYTDSGSYPPTPPPRLGNYMYIYRGDMNKTVTNPWCNTITVSGNAGQRVNASVAIRGTYGEYTTATEPPSVGGTIRAIMFNELQWNTDYLTTFADLNGYAGDSYFAPRDFTLTVNNNLQNDDSYNDENPQALRGFTYGIQDISCDMGFLGGASPHRGGTESGYPNPLFTALASGADFDIGGLYTILEGIWTTRTMVVAGNQDLNVTRATFAGLAPTASSVYCIQPSTLLGGV